MSRSYRKSVWKAKSTQEKRYYNKIYKSRCRQITRGLKNLSEENINDVTYPVLNESMDFWCWCDYVMKFVHKKLGGWNDDWRKRITRK